MRNISSHDSACGSLGFCCLLFSAGLRMQCTADPLQHVPAEDEHDTLKALCVFLLASNPRSAFVAPSGPPASKIGTLPLLGRRRQHAGMQATLSRSEETFEKGYSMLEAFVSEHRHCNVPSKFVTADGYRLGAWLGRQKRKCKDGDLSESQEGRLKTLGMKLARRMSGPRGGRPVDDDSSADEKWEKGLAKLVEYKEEHSHCNVPHSFVTADGFRLGLWLSYQRDKYKGQRGGMTESQQSRLEEVGVEWDPMAKAWEDAYLHLEACKQELGDCNVPPRYVSPDGFRLGRWVQNQRDKYRGKRGGLSEEQVSRLEALGMVMDQAGKAWQEAYALLEAYKAEHGDCNVPEGFITEDGFNLAAWVSHHRKKYQGGMTALEEPEQSRFKALQSLGMTF
mmetsp:Transcript_42311/g.75811  ORF Transcript_42311/g.75811 Transcript_42311/m.75811 type:complete len:394 (-) Transcript_42311:114-1295(-)